MLVPLALCLLALWRRKAVDRAVLGRHSPDYVHGDMVLIATQQRDPLVKNASYVSSLTPGATANRCAQCAAKTAFCICNDAEQRRRAMSKVIQVPLQVPGSRLHSNQMYVSADRNARPDAAPSAPDMLPSHHANLMYERSAVPTGVGEATQQLTTAFHTNSMFTRTGGDASVGAPIMSAPGMPPPHHANLMYDSAVPSDDAAPQQHRSSDARALLGQGVAATSYGGMVASDHTETETDDPHDSTAMYAEVGPPEYAEVTGPAWCGKTSSPEGGTATHPIQAETGQFPTTQGDEVGAPEYAEVDAPALDEEVGVVPLSRSPASLLLLQPHTAKSCLRATHPTCAMAVVRSFVRACRSVFVSLLISCEPSGLTPKIICHTPCCLHMATVRRWRKYAGSVAGIQYHLCTGNERIIRNTDRPSATCTHKDSWFSDGPK